MAQGNATVSGGSSQEEEGEGGAGDEGGGGGGGSDATVVSGEGTEEGEGGGGWDWVDGAQAQTGAGLTGSEPPVNATSVVGEGTSSVGAGGQDSEEEGLGGAEYGGNDAGEGGQGSAQLNPAISSLTQQQDGNGINSGSGNGGGSGSRGSSSSSSSSADPVAGLPQEEELVEEAEQYGGYGGVYKNPPLEIESDSGSTWNSERGNTATDENGASARSSSSGGGGLSSYSTADGGHIVAVDDDEQHAPEQPSGGSWNWVGEKQLDQGRNSGEEGEEEWQVQSGGGGGGGYGSGGSGSSDGRGRYGDSMYGAGGNQQGKDGEFADRFEGGNSLDQGKMAEVKAASSSLDGEEGQASDMDPPGGFPASNQEGGEPTGGGGSSGSGGGGDASSSGGGGEGGDAGSNGGGGGGGGASGGGGGGGSVGSRCQIEADCVGTRVKCSKNGECECQFPWSGGQCEEDVCGAHTSCNECRDAQTAAAATSATADNPIADMYGCKWNGSLCVVKSRQGGDDELAQCSGGAEYQATPLPLWLSAGLPLVLVFACGGLLVFLAKCVRKCFGGGPSGPAYTP